MGATVTATRSGLTPEQVGQYRRDGYVFPIAALAPAEVAGIRRRLEDYETSHGGPLTGAMRHKPHLLFP